MQSLSTNTNVRATLCGLSISVLLASCVPATSTSLPLIGPTTPATAQPILLPDATASLPGATPSSVPASIAPAEFSDLPATSAHPDWHSFTNPNELTGGAIFQSDSVLWVGGLGGVTKWDFSDHTYTTFRSEHGLPGNAVRAMALSPQGELWIATFYGKLARFDGVLWHTDIPSPPLHPESLGAFVMDIEFTPDSALWVAAGEGLFRLADGMWTLFFPVGSSLLDDSPQYNSLAVDSTGRLWAGGTGSLSVFDGASWTHWMADEGYPTTTVDALAAADNGTVWIYSLGAVYSMVSGHFEQMPPWQLPFPTVVHAIHAMHNGDIWFGTDHGIAILDGLHRWLYLTSEDGLPAERILAVTQTPDGCALATTTEGFSILRGETWSVYSIPNTPIQSEITAALFDETEAIWAGTWSGDSGSGISRLSGQEWASYPVGPISAAGMAPNGDLWFVGPQFLALNRHGEWVPNVKAPPQWATPASLAFFPDGTAWVATDGGLFEVVNGTWTHHPESCGSDQARQCRTDAVATSSDGSVWYTLDGYPAQYSDGNLTIYSPQESGEDAFFLAIAVDAQGLPWGGTSHGNLYAYDSGGWSLRVPSTRLPGGMILALAPDASRGLWIGTEQGVCLLQGDHCTTVFTQEDGLAQNAVASIAPHPSGRVLFGTYGGLSIYVPPS